MASLKWSSFSLKLLSLALLQQALLKILSHFSYRPPLGTGMCSEVSLEPSLLWAELSQLSILSLWMLPVRTAGTSQRPANNFLLGSNMELKFCKSPFCFDLVQIPLADDMHEAGAACPRAHLNTEVVNSKKIPYSGKCLFSLLEIVNVTFPQVIFIICPHFHLDLAWYSYAFQIL